MILSRVATAFAITAAALAFSYSPAFAQINKCTDTAGKVVFSDQKCGGTTKGGEIVVRPNELDTSANREALLRAQNAELQERADRAEAREAAAASASAGNGRPQNTAPAPRPDSQECIAARRSYETATSSINPNTRDMDARRSTMYIACNVPEPQRTTINITPNRRSASEGIRRRCVDSQDSDCIRTGVSR